MEELEKGDVSSNHGETSKSQTDKAHARTQDTAIADPSSHLENETPADEDDIIDDGNPNIVAQVILGLRYYLFQIIKGNSKLFSILLAVVMVLLYHAYVSRALYYAVHDLGRIYWCDEVGLLIIITAIIYWAFLYFFVLKKYFGRALYKRVVLPLKKVRKTCHGRWYLRYGCTISFLVVVITFIIIDCRNEPSRLISAGGAFMIIGVCLLISKHPAGIHWSQVAWGVGLQFIFGLIILRWDAGRAVFQCFSSKVETFLGFSTIGSNFIYGYLSNGIHQNFTNGDAFELQPILAFNGLLVIFFFSFCTSILYYYGIMMWVITNLGWLLQITMGTTAAESMSAAANVFVGMIEAPIIIKPFLPDLTLSELHAVMTGGFASIAGTVIGMYIRMRINPVYLLASCVMTAPGALATSKLLYPETMQSKTRVNQLKGVSLKQEATVLDAAAAGATQGVTLVLNIIANIIAFMAFVEFLNAVMQWLGGLVGLDSFKFEWLLGKLFIPVAYAIGVESNDTEDVALLLGLKTVINEFVAYKRMTTMSSLSERSKAIATFALCNFSNFGAIGIQLTGIGCLAPETRADLSQLIGTAFIGGVACGLLNACVAGTLLSTYSDSI